MRVSAYGTSDVGRVREGNEDSLYAGQTVFAVADGMGGHQAGEVASETALEPIRALDGVTFDSAEHARQALVEAVVDANRQVVTKAQSDPSFHGMGTTLTAVLVREGQLLVAHVGDSRAYLLRGHKEMSQLTTDHTLVEELVRDGRISRAEAASHPQRSVITRAIGVEREVQVDALPIVGLQPGDQLLLCSDGLTGPVPDRRIAQTLVAEPDGQAACQTLVDLANEAGGPDNITVVLMRVEGDPDDAKAVTIPGTRAAVVSPDATEELEPPAGDGETPVQIRTREEHSGGDWAGALGRLGAPQGVENRPDHTGMDARTKGRAVAVVLAVAALLALLGGGGWMLLNRAYFVADYNGTVAIYNGLPQQVGGLNFHWVVEESDLPTADLPRRLRTRIAQGVTVGSLGEGRRLIDTYRNDLLEGPDTEPATPSRTPDPTAEADPAP